MIEVTPQLRSWASDIEPQTLEQALKASRLPILAGPVALMPDAHLGIGATVGSVIATDGAVIPAGGRRRPRLRHDRRRDRPVDVAPARRPRPLPRAARGRPPGRPRQVARRRVGRGPRVAGRSPQPGADAEAGADGARPVRHARQRQPLLRGLRRRARRRVDHPALGVARRRQPARDGAHQGRQGHGEGSRTSRWRTPTSRHLQERTPQFDAYIRDMLWSQEYAAANRAPHDGRRAGGVLRASPAPARERLRVNCHHNFAQRETHGGRARVGDAQGRHQGRRRRPRPDPRQHGHALVRDPRARGTRSRTSRARTGRAGG